MPGLWLIPAGLLAAATLSFVTNWLALIPWRRAKHQHWTDRARLYHPVRIAAVANFWVLPAILSMSAFLLWPNDSPHWAIIAFVTSIGAIVGTIPMDREVFPRIPLKGLFRQAAVVWVIRFLMWFVFLASAALMPNEFHALTLIIAAVFLALCIFWTYDGWIRVGRKLGLFLPPHDRLQRIVRDTAVQMKVSIGEIYFMRGFLAQAFAMPESRRLLFTERFVELLSDEEIAAVTAHELAHLTETRSAYLKRHVIWLAFLPWIFLKPILNHFGLVGFVFLLLLSLLASFAFRAVARKMETRADSIAHANEPEPGTYARALLRLYEDALVPAVDAKSNAIHPHLYDRLLAAGVTPDFPRPAPPSPMGWNGVLFSCALGLLVMLLITRLAENW